MAEDNSHLMPSPRSLFKRCVQCPNEQPACPSCASDETCNLIQQSCDACASTSCLKIGSLPGQLAEKPKTPIGPIVGGVVAGIAAVAVITFLLWHFWMKPKRKAMRNSGWVPSEKPASTFAADQASRRSVASTVLSRASNVIQIAYIPGVTVRSPPNSPGLLPPPMPAFPGASATSSAAGTPTVEQHFFMPSDLRGSTWSDASSAMDPRISMAPSLARTTLYGEGAVVTPTPAQQAIRTQANMVSVKSGSSTPSATRTPPVPSVPKLGEGKSSIVAKNVTARPIEIKKAGSGPRVPTLGNLAKAATKKPDSVTESEKSIPVYFDEKEVVVSSPTQGDSPLVKPQPSFASLDSGRSSSVSAIMPAEGPLGSGNITTHRHSKSDGLNAMIEEAINRARDPHMSVRPELKKHDSGPFSDANEVKENL